MHEEGFLHGAMKQLRSACFGRLGTYFIAVIVVHGIRQSEGASRYSAARHSAFPYML